MSVIDRPAPKHFTEIPNKSSSSAPQQQKPSAQTTADFFEEIFDSESTASEPTVTQCPFCLETVLYGARKCKHCGEILDVNLKRHRESNGKKSSSKTEKKVLIAFLLCFFLGMLGIHRFYVGKNGSGAAMLIMTITVALFWVSAIWALLDCIVILTGGFTDENDVPITQWT